MSERGPVRLAGRDRTVPDAILTEHLAVHRSVSHRTYPMWTITHRKSGCAIGHASTEDRAAELAERVETDHPEALKMLDRYNYGKTAHRIAGKPPIKRLIEALVAEGVR